jgi:hypothetical protein
MNPSHPEPQWAHMIWIELYKPNLENIIASPSTEPDLNWNYKMIPSNTVLKVVDNVKEEDVTYVYVDVSWS